MRDVTSRRTMLGRIAVAGAATAAPVVASATEAADPFPTLERAFWRYHNEEGLPDDLEDDDPRFDVYEAGWTSTLAAIVATPATTVAGIRTKVRVLILEITDGESAYGPALARSLLADLDRLAGGTA